MLELVSYKAKHSSTPLGNSRGLSCNDEDDRVLSELGKWGGGNVNWSGPAGCAGNDTQMVVMEEESGRRLQSFL